jgi:hypothetical protein
MQSFVRSPAKAVINVVEKENVGQFLANSKIRGEQATLLKERSCRRRCCFFQGAGSATQPEV